MNPKVRACLYIDDFECTPDSVTSILGIQPTRIWFTGDKIEKSILVKSSNGWMLESPLVKEVDPEIHIKWLIDHLPENLEILRSKTLKWDAQLSLVLEMADETPPFNLTKATIARIAQLGLSLDVDMYIANE